MPIRLAQLKELISHADLTDMPDVGGANTDHDGRYWTVSTDQTGLTGNKTGSFALTTTNTITAGTQGVGNVGFKSHGDIILRLGQRLVFDGKP
jgi:hypothetical protein